MLDIASLSLSSALIVVVGIALFATVLIAVSLGITRSLSRLIGGRRVSAGSMSSPHVEAAQQGEPLGDVGRVGALLGWVGAALVVLAVFLPYASTPFPVSNNTLIQSGTGWILVVFAVAVALECYRVRDRDERTRWVLVAGVLLIAYTIYAGTGSRLDLTFTTSNPLSPTVTRHASPGIGVYMAGIGGAIVALGGATVMGFDAGLGATAVARSRKRCPDCAEVVLADAKVCKHCGYRFDGEHLRS